MSPVDRPGFFAMPDESCFGIASPFTGHGLFAIALGRRAVSLQSSLSDAGIMQTILPPNVGYVNMLHGPVEGIAP
eukprot:2352448-Pleurochrysis_carterae.AAC.1